MSENITSGSDNPLLFSTAELVAFIDGKAENLLPMVATISALEEDSEDKEKKLGYLKIAAEESDLPFPTDEEIAAWQKEMDGKNED